MWWGYIVNKLFKLKLLLLSLIFFSIQCSHQPKNAGVQRQTAAQLASAHEDWLEQLPTDSRNEVDTNILKKVKAQTKTLKLGDVETVKITQRITKYLDFLTYKMSDRQSVEDKDKLRKKNLARLFTSSTQFILCPDILDFNCLERTPIVTPTTDSRVENPNDKLGEAVAAGESLDIEYFFNQQIFTPESEYNHEIGVAKILENKIKADGVSGIYMALYGVDDIEYNEANKTIGSMAGIYNVLMDKIKSKVKVYGVFDQKGLRSGVEKPALFSYLNPQDPDKLDKWILSPVDPKNTLQTNLDFQYNLGTQNLIKALAANAKTEEQAKGRLEYPNQGIMHNKFLVLKNKDQYGIWTGTANVTRTCMGTERNSNMSVYIKNKQIAKSYLQEFFEMYNFKIDADTKGDPNFIGSKDFHFPQGRFHSQKKPNTKRYFKFDDGTEAKVYFSPTDDAEHRAILPLIHSARSGDILRISMFGAAGIEYVRAIQLAAARGVRVEIIVDSPTACGPGSWVGRVGDATLLEENPFDSMAKIQIRKNAKGPGNTWKQNHQKIGLLLRYNLETKEHLAEQITFGSQNWSNSGNDLNDENMIALRKTNSELPIAKSFNEHFTQFLWPKAKNVPPEGCSGPSDVDEEDDSDDASQNSIDATSVDTKLNY